MVGAGEIVSFNFPMNEEGRPRGIAFAKYTSKAGVEAALKFDNSDSGLPLVVVFAAISSIIRIGSPPHRSLPITDHLPTYYILPSTYYICINSSILSC